MTGAAQGRNLGKPGYSHDLVAQIFLPLLERWAKVISVPNPKRNLDSVVSDLRRQNFDPIHFSLIPPQDVYLAKSAPNVIMPAWEFPDVPNHAFDDKEQNNWPAVTNRCQFVIVSGKFTVDAFRNGGTKVPIHEVPVPTPDDYFQVPPWSRTQRMALSTSGRVLVPASRTTTSGHNANLLHRVKAAVRAIAKQLLPPILAEPLGHTLRAGKRWWENRRTTADSKPANSSLDLTGVVYTTIFNPGDGRKNWQDLVTGFVHALRDCDDATLVVKLITTKPILVKKFLDFYNKCDLPHRCKVVLITDYLTEDQLVRLAEASTFYLQATHAEGNCLPLMNYLAAARPGITPVHSAISDYFDEEVGFVVESHPSPASWPHDSEHRFRTTKARIVWPSLVEAIRQSYGIAKHQQTRYDEIAERGRQRMQLRVSKEAVWKNLKAALDTITTDRHSKAA